MGALEDLIASFGNGSYNKHTRDCTAVGCSQRVFGYALFCPECWRQISSDLQRLIEKHHRPGRKPSKHARLEAKNVMAAIDGHDDEPLVAMLIAQELIVAACQATAQRVSVEQGLRLAAGHVADVSSRVLGALPSASTSSRIFQSPIGRG